VKIKGILISALAPFENHIANGGEKLLGNASSIKRRPDGRVYVSGQMQRHVLFSAMNRLNESDENKGETFISNGDGVTNLIEKDLRSDMGGFMHPSKGDYSGRRTAPLSVTPAVAVDSSNVGRDLLVRIRFDESDDAKKQSLATKEFSEYDIMHMNFFLDISALSISKAFIYENGFNIGTKYFKHADNEERKRRVKLFIEATRYMNDYASQSRNAVSGEPQKVIIVFDEKLGRKASRYFVVNEQERKNIIAELDSKKAQYFIGDDETENSVQKAYDNALEYLKENTLYDPSENEAVLTFKEAFGRD
jgi:CRISPR-associated protein Cst2